MNVLIIGQGGREHALVKSLKQSETIESIFVAPGNSGIEIDATCLPVDVKNFPAVLDLCHKHKVDYVIIGPEDPLVLGLSDFLRDQKIPVVGPSQKGAQLEGSKIFAKNFMKKAGIPTAKFHIVKSVSECKDLAPLYTAPYVLKADGLAAGKGVYICKDQTELFAAASELFEKKILGPAGEQAVLEQFTPGWEMSLLFLTNGSEYEILPVAQDHKRLSDNNEGPNTGGMGTIAPLHINPALLEKIKQQVITPTLKILTEQNILYRGVIFLGLMIQNDEVSVLEYNVRFGDPETQVILPLIENDLGQLFFDLANGKLTKINFNQKSACCVIMAAEGYPISVKKNVEILGDIYSQTSDAYFIHAGTIKNESKWYINGGRVLGAVGVGENPKEAIKKAYDQSSKVKWEKLQLRKDIGRYLPIPANTNRT